MFSDVGSVAMALPALLGALVASTLGGKPLSNEECEVRARTTAGWVCGAIRYDVNGEPFASFTNVPYAKQPLGELRFEELQPPEPWDYLYDATGLGPICPQYNIYFGALMTNTKMSEACIHVNIYVPLNALPSRENQTQNSKKRSNGVPLFIFKHGGGYMTGSGDSDLYGPEYLVSKGIGVITFNYRIGAIGYLTLNTPKIPGNNGLRDTVTLLRWVRQNAKYFGGNPFDVTIAGQSTGSSDTHLMVLSRAAKGLFQRAMLMSGVASQGFYAAALKRGEDIANALKKELDINSDDTDEIHQQLIDIPWQQLLNASMQVHMKNMPISFGPVIEKKHPGITPILDEEPECLVRQGVAKEIPLLVGFTDMEGKFFQKGFEQMNIVELVKKTPTLAISLDLQYKLTKETALYYGEKTADRYFGDSPTAEKFSQLFADYAFKYPTLKLLQRRSMTRSAPTYLYEFSYNADFSPIKYTMNITYDGAAHCDDMTTIFKTNSLKDVPELEHPTRSDFEIRQFMLKAVKNFMEYNAPIPISKEENGESWPPQSRHSDIKYEKIYKPNNIFYSELTKDQVDMILYFDHLYESADNKCSRDYADVI